MVQQDFPDVTISKIRFLESQGLLEPERTSSGYRKFYDNDVERLRWILHQQRDNYLPLKVIKDRISNGFADRDRSAPTSSPAPVATAPDGAVEPAPEAPPEARPHHADSPAEPAATTPTEPPPADPLDDGMSTVSMTGDELAAATGLTVTQIEELQAFGLIDSRPIGAADLYEGEALQVAKLAAEFVDRGIEIRHLKMYRTSAEREAGFYEQVVSPYAGRADAAARSRARTEVRELVRLGAELKASLLRRSLREQLGGP